MNENDIKSSFGNENNVVNMSHNFYKRDHKIFRNFKILDSNKPRTSIDLMSKVQPIEVKNNLHSSFLNLLEDRRNEQNFFKTLNINNILDNESSNNKILRIEPICDIERLEKHHAFNKNISEGVIKTQNDNINELRNSINLPEEKHNLEMLDNIRIKESNENYDVHFHIEEKKSNYNLSQKEVIKNDSIDEGNLNNNEKLIFPKNNIIHKSNKQSFKDESCNSNNSKIHLKKKNVTQFDKIASINNKCLEDNKFSSALEILNWEEFKDDQEVKIENLDLFKNNGTEDYFSKNQDTNIKNKLIDREKENINNVDDNSNFKMYNIEKIEIEKNQKEIAEIKNHENTTLKQNIIFNDFYKKINNDSKKKSFNQNLSEIKLECIICEKIINQFNIIDLACNHAICRKCAKVYYEDKIENRNFIFKCPVYFCKGFFALNQMENIISNNHYIIMNKHFGEELLEQSPKLVNDLFTDNTKNLLQTRIKSIENGDSNLKSENTHFDQNKITKENVQGEKIIEGTNILIDASKINSSNIMIDKINNSNFTNTSSNREINLEKTNATCINKNDRTNDTESKEKKKHNVKFLSIKTLDLSKKLLSKHSNKKFLNKKYNNSDHNSSNNSKSILEKNKQKFKDDKLFLKIPSIEPKEAKIEINDVKEIKEKIESPKSVKQNDLYDMKKETYIVDGIRLELLKMNQIFKMNKSYNELDNYVGKKVKRKNLSGKSMTLQDDSKIKIKNKFKKFCSINKFQRKISNRITFGMDKIMNIRKIWKMKNIYSTLKKNNIRSNLRKNKILVNHKKISFLLPADHKEHSTLIKKSIKSRRNKSLINFHHKIPFKLLDTVSKSHLKKTLNFFNPPNLKLNIIDDPIIANKSSDSNVNDSSGSHQANNNNAKILNGINLIPYKEIKGSNINKENEKGNHFKGVEKPMDNDINFKTNNNISVSNLNCIKNTSEIFNKNLTSKFDLKMTDFNVASGIENFKFQNEKNMHEYTLNKNSMSINNPGNNVLYSNMNNRTYYKSTIADTMKVFIKKNVFEISDNNETFFYMNKLKEFFCSNCKEASLYGKLNTNYIKCLNCFMKFCRYCLKSLTLNHFDNSNLNRCRVFIRKKYGNSSIKNPTNLTDYQSYDKIIKFALEYLLLLMAYFLLVGYFFSYIGKILIYKKTWRIEKDSKLLIFRRKSYNILALFINIFILMIKINYFLICFMLSIVMIPYYPLLLNIFQYFLK